MKRIIRIGQHGLANDAEAIANGRQDHNSVITSEEIRRHEVE